MLLTKQKLKCNISLLKLLFGAIFEALIACLILLIPSPFYVAKNIFCMTLGSLFMIKIIFPCSNFKGMIIIVAIMLKYTFLLGGCLFFIFQKISIFSQYAISIWGIMGGAGITYILCLLALGKEKEVAEEICQVILVKNTKKINVIGFLDSGNSLSEPISKKPVSIVENIVIEQLLSKEEQTFFRVVPYHSIGKQGGILKAYKINELIIIRQGIKYIHKDCYVGISDINLSTNENYQMILHPKLIEG